MENLVNIYFEPESLRYSIFTKFPHILRTVYIYCKYKILNIVLKMCAIIMNSFLRDSVTRFSTLVFIIKTSNLGTFKYKVEFAK
jgi:hypothetical protein